MKIPGTAVAEMAWGHLRTSERSLLKSITYPATVGGAIAHLPVKEDWKELRAAITKMEIGSPAEPYGDRDSSTETRRLSQWLAGPPCLPKQVGKTKGTSIYILRCTGKGSESCAPTGKEIKQAQHTS